MLDIAKWKANVNGATEATEHASRLLLMSRRGSGATRGTYAAEAAKALTMAAKMASDAAKALTPPKATTTPPPAKPAVKRTPGKKSAVKAKPRGRK
jgi:hypothetical protein